MRQCVIKEFKVLFEVLLEAVICIFSHKPAIRSFLGLIMREMSNSAAFGRETFDDGMR